MTSDFKPRIRLLTHTRSGCNCRALYEKIPSYISEKYDVQLLDSDYYSEIPEEVADSEIVVTTHRDFYPRKHQFNIELWHGFGPKTTGAMEVPIKSMMSSREYLYSYFKHINAIASYSPFCSAMVNAGFHAIGEVYQVTGMPRNDVLFTSKGHEKLEVIFNRSFKTNKLVFYMPTWRDQYVNLNKSDGERVWNNIFDLLEFDYDSFDNFLKQNKIILIVKLHPFEESLVLEKINNLPSSNILFLTSTLLEINDLQLYELLNASDLLVTDYSSVYMDYLLLDKPVMFIPSDYKKYEETRGFWLTPYEFWAPGPKVTTQSEFENELVKSLEDKSYFKQQRNYVKSIVHHYKDDQSSTRVWKVIDDLWEGELKIQDPVFNYVDKDILLLRETIKSKINDMLNNNFLDNAAQSILEYENEVSNDPEILTLKASLNYLKSNINEAILFLRESYVIDPKNIDNLFNLGFMYKVDGDIRKSTFYFEKFISNAAHNNKYEELIIQAGEHLKENHNLV
ncbi:CDP-glycerol glycerophosphotransferase (TagB/SpsB family) [Paenibacillus favisporus]|uniref:CDP-glycerol glycerophosphotransferase (TagB/SpsB family) n=1 Tax=Paenibacillus favisporus TaxID=221028 RepID=A0ABV2F8N2_9BACL